MFRCEWMTLRRSTAIARERSALRLLSDHLLKDIGLSRGDLDGIATHANATGGHNLPGRPTSR